MSALPTKHAEVFSAVRKALDGVELFAAEVVALHAAKVSAWGSIWSQIVAGESNRSAQVGSVVCSTETCDRSFVVYGLREKGSELIRYVGQSQNFRARFGSHIGLSDGSPNPKGEKVGAWVRAVLAQGGHVEMVVIDTAADRAEALFKETVWIAVHYDRDPREADLNTRRDRDADKAIRAARVQPVARGVMA